MYHLRCYQLAVQFYKQVQGVNLPGALKNQLQRAASSIALNLSEGTGRRTRRDRIRFFQIALGSIRECQAIIDLEHCRFNHIQRDLLDHLAASTFKLTRNPAPQTLGLLPPAACQYERLSFVPRPTKKRKRVNDDDKIRIRPNSLTCAKSLKRQPRFVISNIIAK